MKVKRLKEIISDLDDDLEIFIRNTVNPCGNIQELDQIELTTYGFFGTEITCAILNTDSSKKMEYNEDEEVIDFVK
ncbi:hypothetical protein [Anaerosacchariphilus polymeriproducens]|uniref:Uncharacterized protein n=1 Tax=Anaerosacchariphilus polymeriproducens TaxID=1812858 RepID=A0A371ATI0_9FIRM|nr:hypothetical protein [Anaerosacchariphilus polymeriproducens]RDU22877.1 hypothetical protein DWV06_12455 [Anaerosacchariphilus polymeriproducens]